FVFAPREMGSVCTCTSRPPCTSLRHAIAIRGQRRIPRNCRDAAGGGDGVGIDQTGGMGRPTPGVRTLTAAETAQGNRRKLLFPLLLQEVVKGSRSRCPFLSSTTTRRCARRSAKCCAPRASA